MLQPYVKLYIHREYKLWHTQVHCTHISTLRIKLLVTTSMPSQYSLRRSILALVLVLLLVVLLVVAVEGYAWETIYNF